MAEGANYLVHHLPRVARLIEERSTQTIKSQSLASTPQQRAQTTIKNIFAPMIKPSNADILRFFLTPTVMERMQFDVFSVPLQVSEQSSWPWWRRQVKLPPPDIFARMKAWAELQKKLDEMERSDVHSKFKLKRANIFFGSIVALDFICFGTPLSLDGYVRSANGVRSTETLCPFGSLTKREMISEFLFDITDVEGISASKSSGKFFDSVCDFGRHFTKSCGTPIDAEGLAQMLSHYEIRITQKDRGDFLSIRLWDGRLFLNNSGGSHHFAGAAYIAAQTKIRLPIVAKLQVDSINEATVRWLTSEYVALSVPRAKAKEFCRLTATIVGSCSYLVLHETIVSDAALLLIPKRHPTNDFLLQLYAQAGIADIKGWFCDLIGAQKINQATFMERFRLAWKT